MLQYLIHYWFFSQWDWEEIQMERQNLSSNLHLQSWLVGRLFYCFLLPFSRPFLHIFFCGKGLQVENKYITCLVSVCALLVVKKFWISLHIYISLSLYIERETERQREMYMCIIQAGYPGGSEIKNSPAMQETWVWSLGQAWRRKWQPTPIFLLEKSYWQRRLAGYSPQGCKKSRTQLSD